MRTLTARPLTAGAYAPFGEVVMASGGAEAGRPANLGTARRFDHLASLQNLRPARAALNVCLFRAEPRLEFPFEVRLLERHRQSSQLFVPMNAQRYLVIVAPGEAAPVWDRLSAFVADGLQGVSYHPGTWHHPLLALETRTDFTCLVYEDGTTDDCEVVDLPTSARIRVALPEGS